MSQVADGVYTQDRDGRLMYMNRAASKMLGWTEDELRGKHMHDVVHFQRSDGSRVERRRLRAAHRGVARPARTERRRGVHPKGRVHLPGGLLRRPVAYRVEGRGRRRGLPRHQRARRRPRM